MKKIILFLMIFVLSGCNINIGTPNEMTSGSNIGNHNQNNTNTCNNNHDNSNNNHNNSNNNHNNSNNNQNNINNGHNNQNKTPNFSEYKYYGQSGNVYAEIEYKFNRIDDVSFDFNGPDDIYDAMSDSVENYIEHYQKFPNQNEIFLTDVNVFNNMKAAFEQAYNNIK